MQLKQTKTKNNNNKSVQNKQSKLNEAQAKTRERNQTEWAARQPPRLHAFLNKGIFDRRLKCNKIFVDEFIP